MFSIPAHCYIITHAEKSNSAAIYVDPTVMMFVACAEVFKWYLFDIFSMEK